MNDDRPAKPVSLWSLVGLGGFVVACLIVGMGLGWLLDDRLHTLPVFTLIGLGCGMAGGAVGAWVRIRPFLRG